MSVGFSRLARNAKKKTMADCREELEGEEIKRFIADDNGGADGVGRVGYCGGFFLC